MLRLAGCWQAPLRPHGTASSAGTCADCDYTDKDLHEPVLMNRRIVSRTCRYSLEEQRFFNRNKKIRPSSTNEEYKSSPPQGGVEGNNGKKNLAKVRRIDQG